MGLPSFERIQDVFGRACSLDGEDRRRFLDEACADDPALRSEVEDLLARDARPGNSLRAGLAPRAETALLDDGPLPERVGQYRVLGVIGRGGMGLVLRARQEDPPRVVALKVIRPGACSEQLLRRFELEKQILARLQHPGIAQIFEAGTTDQGAGVQPWFAMELVEGRPLAEWAEGAGVRERLQLVDQVCAAVEHAHRKGVIHRDLKPDNILVTADGRAKVLDFGVARLADSGDRLTDVRTGVLSLVGTLPYMSPEQVAGPSEELDARSDVYSLGVVLYELLAGALPYDLLDKPLAEAARVIGSEDPNPLSSADRTFRGDLDTIVAKALEKEPARRYASMAELAADLERYLADEPISARPPSTLYQLRKFARRNRGLVAGLTTAFLVLVLAVIGLSVLTLRARDAERRASRQVEVMTGVNRYLERILSSNDPYGTGEGLGRSARIVDVLDAATREVGTVFGDAPEQEAAVRMMLGTALSNMDEPEAAERELQRSIEVYGTLEGGELRRLEARLQLGLVLGALERGVEERLAHWSAVYEDAQRLLGPRDALTFDAARYLCHTYHETGELARASDLLAGLMWDCREALGEDSSIYVGMVNQQALYLAVQGRLEEALVSFQEAAHAFERIAGADHPNTLIARTNLAQCLGDLGRDEESLEELRLVHAAYRRQLGPSEEHTVLALLQIVDTLRDLGREEGALAAAEELAVAVEGKRETRVVFDARRACAELLHAAGRAEEAEVHCREAIRGLADTRGRFECRRLLARILRDQGDADGAAAELTDLLADMAAEGLADTDELVAQVRGELGEER